MSSKYKYFPIEVINQKSLKNLPSSFCLNTTSIVDYRACLIRLLCGTIDIGLINSPGRIIQRENYSYLTNIKNKRLSSKTIINSFSGSQGNLTRDKIQSYFINNRASNTKFFKELFFEFCSYFECKTNKDFVKGFLHIYRILESIALCLPLMWVACAKDYEKSYDDLKKYFSDPKLGERKLLQRFVRDLIDQNLRTTNISLVIHSSDIDWQQQYYDTLLESSNKDMELISNDHRVKSTPFSEIVVYAESLIDLTINVRDRYFHFLTGRGQSFNSSQIPEPNEFFAIICEPILNWLSVILFELVTHEIINQS